MISSILTSLAVLAVFMAVVAGWAATGCAVRAFRFRVTQLVSSEVKALEPPGTLTHSEPAEQAVPELKRRFLKLMAVSLIFMAIGAALALFRNWLSGQIG